MREVHSLLSSIKSHHGITPAYAGSTQLSSYQLVFLLGSPPRMREVLSVINVSDVSTGITPAYAGSTLCNKCLRCFYRDHPRVCGKYGEMMNDVMSKLGSPPRMREVRKVGEIYRVSGRITPAYAGSTYRYRHIHSQLEDHPRVCGKY